MIILFLACFIYTPAFILHFVISNRKLYALCAIVSSLIISYCGHKFFSYKGDANGLAVAFAMFVFLIAALGLLSGAVARAILLATGLSMVDKRARIVTLICLIIPLLKIVLGSMGYSFRSII